MFPVGYNFFAELHPWTKFLDETLTAVEHGTESAKNWCLGTK